MSLRYLTFSVQVQTITFVSVSIPIGRLLIGLVRRLWIVVTFDQGGQGV